MKPHSPQPQHSKSTQSPTRTPKKLGKKKGGSEQDSHLKPGSKRQSRSDTELCKSTSATTRSPQRRRRSHSVAIVQTNYAGPIFNNAPEPSSLPLPSFLPPRPRTTSFHTIDDKPGQQQFPAKMATAHDKQDPSLIELQQRLSSMLKLV